LHKLINESKTEVVNCNNICERMYETKVIHRKKH